MGDGGAMREARAGAGTRRSRRRWLAAIAGGTLAAAVPRAFAQVQRGGVVRLVLGFQAGGSADRVARILAPELGQRQGRSAIVENVPGANSARAIQRVVIAEPNGDTLLMATSAIAHPDNAASIDALRPVIVTSIAPMTLVVRADLPVTDPASFARWLRATPAAAYGSAGIGNGTHLAAAELVDALGAQATHVPYAGSSAGFGDLIGGRIDFMVTGASAMHSQHPGVRVIAISTRTRSRLPGLAALPTLAETIAPGFDASLWQAVYAPGRMPDDAIAALNAQFRDILAQESVRLALAETGAEVRSGTPADADALYRAELARYRLRVAR